MTFASGRFRRRVVGVRIGKVRALTNAASCIVISVNYRHAPDHKFPAAANDAYAATRFVDEHAAEFNGDARPNSLPKKTFAVTWYQRRIGTGRC